MKDPELKEEGAELKALMKAKGRSPKEVAEGIDRPVGSVYAATAGLVGMGFTQEVIRNYLKPLPDVEGAETGDEETPPRKEKKPRKAANARNPRVAAPETETITESEMRVVEKLREYRASQRQTQEHLDAAIALFDEDDESEEEEAGLIHCAAPPPMSSNPAITSLHECYVKLSGFPIRLDATREHSWFDFMAAGWGERELRLVMLYLRKEISSGKRNLGALKFSNLVQQLDRFEEDLGMAQHASRGRAVLTSIVRTPGGIIERIDESVTAPPVQLDRTMAAAALRDFADQLGAKKEQTK